MRTSSASASSSGAVAAFPDGDLSKGIPYVHNIPHPISAYVTAFVAAGLSIAACIEPTFTEHLVSFGAAYAVFPEASRQAFLGLPFLLVWHLRRP